MNSNVFGIDIAKHVPQIHWVDQETGEIHSDKVKRKDFVQFFANHQPSTINDKNGSLWWCSPLGKTV